MRCTAHVSPAQIKRMRDHTEGSAARQVGCLHAALGRPCEANKFPDCVTVPACFACEVFCRMRAHCGPILIEHLRKEHIISRERQQLNSLQTAPNSVAFGCKHVGSGHLGAWRSHRCVRIHRSCRRRRAAHPCITPQRSGPFMGDWDSGRAT